MYAKGEIETDTSSDSSDSSSDLEETDNVNRQKRDVKWCGVSDEQPPPKAHWPPASSSRSHYVHIPSRPRWTQWKMQLYSKTEYHLAVYPDGRVFGTKDDTDLHTFLELMPGGGTSLVKIKGLLSNMYVGMNHKGKLYAEPDPLSDNIIFIEDFQGLYTTYKSKKFEKRGWYIGIKKNGKFKRGRKTNAGQKAVKFIPRRKRFE